MVYAWCSHCLDFCRMALDAGFISCSSCGKVLGEVSVKTASNIKRNTKPRRIKRLTKKKTQSLVGVDSFLLYDAKN